MQHWTSSINYRCVVRFNSIELLSNKILSVASHTVLFRQDIREVAKNQTFLWLYTFGVIHSWNHQEQFMIDCSWYRQCEYICIVFFLSSVDNCHGWIRAHIVPSTVTAFSSCTKCMGSPGIIHDRDHPASGAGIHGWSHNWIRMLPLGHWWA